MKKSVNEVLIRRSNSILVSESEGVGNDVLSAFLDEMYRLGFAVNSELYSKLKLSDSGQLTDILSIAREMKGDQVNYRPMYPNFPEQVQNAPDLELYVNAVVHYVGSAVGLTLLPDYKASERKDSTSEYEATVLGVADMNSVKILARDLFTQGQPFSSQDQGDAITLSEFIDGPLEVSVKENLAFIAVNTDVDVSDSVKTLTDVLRIAAVLSGGDASLSEKFKFKLSRPQRRFVKGLLDDVLEKNGENYEDFARRPEMWKRLAKTLHLSEGDQVRLKRANEAIYSENFRSFNSLVESTLQDEFANGAVHVLKDRPGEFARRLHELIRKFPNDSDMILDEFRRVSQEVSLRVLIQMYDFFSGPKDDVLPRRAVSFKSRNVKSGLMVNSLRSSCDYSKVLEAVESGFKGRLSDRSFTVDMDEASQYAISTGQRSASSGMRVIGRGSRIRFSSDSKVIRLFQHWRNIDSDDWYSRVDLDLTGYLVKDDFTDPITIAYYNLRDTKINALHSGDIVDAPVGAAEFIDLDIESALREGYRYAAMTVYNYSGQYLCDVPEAWAGIMVRNEIGNEGEIFDPKTVEMRYDLSIRSINSLPLIVDLKEREIIWVDSSVAPNMGRVYNLHSNEEKFSTTMKSLTLGDRMTVAKLLELTGARVNVDDEAEVLDPTSTEKVLGLIS